jgi:hypothetical protein
MSHSRIVKNYRQSTKYLRGPGVNASRIVEQAPARERLMSTEGSGGYWCEVDSSGMYFVDIQIIIR